MNIWEIPILIMIIEVLCILKKLHMIHIMEISLNMEMRRQKLKTPLKEIKTKKNLPRMAA